MPRFSLWRNRNARAFFGLLIAGDLLLIGLHLLHVYSRHYSDIGYSSSAFSLSQDGSVAETYQYLKTFWIVLLLIGVTFRTGRLSYLSWSAFFLYLVLDDSLRLHERLGTLVSHRMGYISAFHLLPQDFGELSVVATIGLFFAAILALTWWRSDREFRMASRDLALLVGLLVLFGVGVDVLHSMARGAALKAAMAMVEDGGEMIAMSLLCWYTYELFLRRGRLDPAGARTPSSPPSPA